ncbi:hypothetical protein ACIQWA_22750 [Kitasatospora sp. NPDC098652]|uniref:hypothetical protein n=1 Tax=Kitasatospora sp. NPDC098652 TaxID=3364095 RepID=UPI003828DB5F
MAAPPHVVLGPLPAALHHRPDRCARRPRRARPTGRARRLVAAAVLGLTLPLAAATGAVAAPAPGASAPADARADAPVPGGKAQRAAQPDQSDQSDQLDQVDQLDQLDQVDPSAQADGADQGWSSPKAAPPQYGVPDRSRPDLAELRAHRHHPAAVLERPDQAVGQVPDQAPDQAAAQAPDQAVEQPPEQPPAQAPDQGAQADRPDPAPDTSDAQDPAVDQDTVTTAAQPLTATAASGVLPARWQDPSTLQLPLGVGLGLIGCGLGLVGLRLRKG